MKKIHRFLAVFLAASMLAASVGCQKEVTAEDLLANVQSGNASESILSENFCRRYSSTAFKMLGSQYSAEGGNIILCPMAAYYNMGMLANGAGESTKSTIKDLFEKNIADDQVNVFMHSYMESLKDTDQSKLYFKNAIWFNSDKNVQPSESFLTSVKTYYNSVAYRESFGKEAANNINNWVSNSTNMMVESIIDDVPSDAPAFLISAAYVDADWETPIAPENIVTNTFTSISGAAEDVQMMSSYEYIYLSSDEGRGFMKNYAGKNYAFVAILPKQEGEYGVNNLITALGSGNYFFQMTHKKYSRTVDASIPKFSCEFIGDMKPVLESVNLGKVYNGPEANLGSVGSCDGKMFIGGLHSYAGLSVTEKGTSKGSGATVSNSVADSSMIPVALDRPFVFAIVDTQYYLPIMVGVVNTIKG